MNERLRAQREIFERQFNERRINRETSSRRDIAEGVRLALFDLAAFNSLPEQLHFQVDFGGMEGMDLVFNTRQAQVFIPAPWQDHDIRVGIGDDWINYFGPIVDAMEREVSGSQG